MSLFCFPYAGAGPVVFHGWPEALSDQIEVIALHLPGRETRLREAPYTAMRPLVDALVIEMRPWLQRPYALFGHSVGGLIAYEVARTLRSRNEPPPAHLFISSRRAPHLSEPFPPIHTLNDDEFTRAVQMRYNGIPTVIAQDPELLALFLPVMKADFAVFETYPYVPEPAFDFPISVYGGKQDAGLDARDLMAWQAHTRLPVSISIFEGDHFYLQKQRAPLLQDISRTLAGKY